MNNLDELMIKNGEEFNEDNLNLVDKSAIEKKLNNPFAYDTNTPIPGEEIDDKISDQLNSINEETALDSLITKAAIIKAKKESKENKGKLSKEELAKIKPDFCAQLLYQQEEDYFNKYHYRMSGKVKRSTRKRIERNFDKGRYNKYLYNNHQSLND